MSTETEKETDKIQTVKKECERIKEEITRKRNDKDDKDLNTVAKSLPALTRVDMKARRVLRGHLARVYALQFAEDSKTIVTAAEDGNLLIWDAKTTHKLHVIPVQSAWILTCAFAPLETQLVACGGLESVCSIYSFRSTELPSRPLRELSAHSGFISCARFLNSNSLITSSADMTSIQWDVEKGSKVTSFVDHNSDVMSIAISSDKNTFVSGSCDFTAKIWDIRSSRCEQTLTGHKADINTVQYFPNMLSFATGSDDATCRLYDVRADRELQIFSHDDVINQVTSLDFSRSGRLLFVGYADRHCLCWDVLKGTRVASLAHANNVSCLCTANDGSALATGSWDTLVRIWA